MAWHGSHPDAGTEERLAKENDIGTRGLLVQFIFSVNKKLRGNAG